MESVFLRQRSLGATWVALLGSFLVSLSLAHAQLANRPTVAPEQQRLAVFVGEWSYEGTAKDSLLGPGGHYSGKQTVRFAMDGLFLKSHAQITGVYGGKEIVWE